MIKLFLLKYLSGLWGYVAIAVIAGGAVFGATRWIDGLTYGHTIDGLKLSAAQNHDAGVTASLNQLQTFIDGMHSADANYNATLAAINARFDALQGTFKNATQKPLPIDCVPDAGRLQYAASAIAAANKRPAPAR